MDPVEGPKLSAALVLASAQRLESGLEQRVARQVHLKSTSNPRMLGSSAPNHVSACCRFGRAITGEQLLEGLRAKARRSGCGGSGCHRCCGGSGCRRGCGGSGCGDGGWRRSCVFRNYLSCCVCTLLFSLFGLLLCFMFSLSDWAGWTIGRGVATKEEAAAGQQKRGASREDS